MAIAHAIADRARQQTTTTGTGTLSLGTVPSGARGIVASVGTGKTVRYHIYASDGTWESGEGVAAAGTPDTLSRVTVFANSAGTTAKITLPTGTHTVDVTLESRSVNEMTPRSLSLGNGLTFSAGVLTIDCMYSTDVFFVYTLSANVTSVTIVNAPERCTVHGKITQPGAGGPYTLPQSAWPNGTVLETAYYLNTDTIPTRFWWTTTDGGTTATLECNAPFSITRAPAISAGAITVDAAGISDVTVNLALTANVSSIALQNVPADCRMRFVVTQSGGPWSIAASAWPAGTIVQPHALAPTGTTVIEWETRDGGTSALARAPAAFAPALALLPLSPLIPLPAGRWFDQCLLSAAHSTLTGVAGRVDVCGLLRPFDVAINQAGVEVTTAVAAATGRVVIYGATSAGVPGPLLYLGTADLDLSTLGFKSHTLAFTFQAGKLYYVGFMHGSTAVIRAIQGYSLPAFGLASSTATAPLSVLSQTVTYPNAPAEFVFDASAHLATRAAPSVRMRVA